MGIFEKIEVDGFEQIVFCDDRKTGLRAIISLHSTVLGPATGGCRVWHYESEEDALFDVLRLAKGMTYKASVSGLNWGGGKAVIMLDRSQAKKPGMFEKFGEFVERLGGHYITAKDVGVSSDNLRSVKKKTKHVLGIEGDPGSSGDPSPATSYGVFCGIKASAEFAFGAQSLKGMRIAIQGLGSVAYHLLEYLHQEGVIITACDIDEERIKKAASKYNIEIVAPESIYDVKCDIFSPAALGAVINSQTIGRITAKVIAGAANNQLATSEDGTTLMKKSVVYVPDYVINAGGLINIYNEMPNLGGYDQKRTFQQIAEIGPRVTQILERAKSEKMPPHIIADRIAEERIEKQRKKI